MLARYGADPWMALAALLEMAAEDIWVRDPEWAKLCRLLPPKLPFTATVANGRDGWKADPSYQISEQASDHSGNAGPAVRNPCG